MFIKLLFSFHPPCPKLWTRVQSTVQLIFINLLQINIQKIPVVECPSVEGDTDWVVCFLYIIKFCILQFCITKPSVSMRMLVVIAQATDCYTAKPHLKHVGRYTVLYGAERWTIVWGMWTFNDWNFLNVDLEKVNENQLDSGLNTDPRGFGRGGWKKKLDEHHLTKTDKLVRLGYVLRNESFLRRPVVIRYIVLESRMD